MKPYSSQMVTAIVRIAGDLQHLAGASSALIPEENRTICQFPKKVHSLCIATGAIPSSHCWLLAFSQYKASSADWFQRERIKAPFLEENDLATRKPCCNQYHSRIVPASSSNHNPHSQGQRTLHAPINKSKIINA